MAKEFLYCYKMRHDTGFAPNTYHGVLTLATCKPTIRRCAEIGYWISGWTSNVVYGKNNIKKVFTDDTQKLIYLAKVTDKIKIEDYWKKYDYKRPQKILIGKENTTNRCGGKNCTSSLYNMGDNIYEPIKGKKDEFKQLPNGGGHGPDNEKRDLSGKYVLICEEFYYFGVEHAVEIKVDDNFVVPRCKKIPLYDPKAQSIIEQVKKKYEQEIKSKQL